ncbi:unnamed protein product [Prunus brigantina]
MSCCTMQHIGISSHCGLSENTVHWFSCLPKGLETRTTSKGVHGLANTTRTNKSLF